MTEDEGLKAPDIRAFCEVLSEEDLVKTHNVGIEIITEFNSK